MKAFTYHVFCSPGQNHMYLDPICWKGLAASFDPQSCNIEKKQSEELFYALIVSLPCCCVH